ncbi:hypothetical protein DSM21852_11330 [Methylocystis bryophila]|nr:hypothetical protein DSM21852_11330 [Methylocystis bryophila]
MKKATGPREIRRTSAPIRRIIFLSAGDKSVTHSIAGGFSLAAPRAGRAGESGAPSSFARGFAIGFLAARLCKDLIEGAAIQQHRG